MCVCVCDILRQFYFSKYQYWLKLKTQTTVYCNRVIYSDCKCQERIFNYNCHEKNIIQMYIVQRILDYYTCISNSYLKIFIMRLKVFIQGSTDCNTIWDTTSEVYCNQVARFRLTQLSVDRMSRVCITCNMSLVNSIFQISMSRLCRLSQ